MQTRNGSPASAMLGIRSGEWRASWLFFWYFLILATAYYAAKSVRQSTFIDSLGAEMLPGVYLAVALLSFPVLVVYSKLADRYHHSTLIVVSCAAQAVGFALFFLLFGLDQAWVAVAFYVCLTVAFGVAVSQYWSFAHDCFDARQARRLFAFIGAGGLLGGVPGGQLARIVTERFGTRYTLLGSALLMLVVLVIVMAIKSLHESRDERSDAKKKPLRRFGDARVGLKILKSSHLVLLIACLMLLTVVVAQMIDLQFNWAVEQNTTSLDERTELLGNFFSVMGILAFIFQLVATRWIHRRLGVEVGIRVLPASVAVTCALFLVAMGFLPGLLFAIAVIMKMTETGMKNSIEQSSRELLFQPVSEQVRTQAKAFIDVFVQRFGKGVAAILLLPVTFGLVSINQVPWLMLALAVVWLGLTWVVQRAYVNEFREGLVSGVLQEPAVIDPDDLNTVITLVQSLGSSEPRQVLHSLELLHSNGHGNLVPPLLLHHTDPEVRRKTLEVLAVAGREDAAPLVEKAMTDEDPEVRSGAMQTLAVLRGDRATSIMIPRLRDPDPGVRATAAGNLLEGPNSDAAAQAEATLLEMAADPEAAVRAEVARALATVKEPLACATLVQLLYDSDISVVRETVHTLRERMARDGRNPIYIPILVSLMGNRRLKHDAREALVACGEGAIGAMALFMGSGDEQIWVRRAVPKTIALAGTQQAADTLIASLDEGDTFLRSKIIDALTYMRSRGDGLEYPFQAIRRQIRREKERYLETLAHLWAVSAERPPVLEGPVAEFKVMEGQPMLIEQLLALRLRRSVDCVFGLLGLIYPLDDVRAARRSLLSGSNQLRARALEYMENTLRGDLRKEVFAVIDDESPEGKLERAQRTRGRSHLTGEAALRRMLHLDLSFDPSAVGRVVASIHAVFAEELESLYPELEALAADAEDGWVRETARWALVRISGGGERAAAIDDDGKGGGRMSAMAHIEMVVFLQRVDLFSFCTAEQVVQLAAIASERKCIKDEVIFRRKDPPDTLYCVVEGTVCVRQPGREDIWVRAGGRFGVVDILSGRPRSYDAIALDEGTRLLAIEAEDLFDLLSHNIEIVKALFRQVL